MMRNVHVSFILPAYKARFLKEAITSILSQTYTNFDLFIIDDSSPEDLRTIVEEFHDTRIQYIRNPENIGGTNLVQQWNHCLQYATGEYMVLAADDDTYHKDFLQECLQLALENPNVDLIHSRVATINENDQLIGIDGVVPKVLSKHGFLYYWLQGLVSTCIGNYMFKRSAIINKKFIDFPSAFCSDAATAIDLAENGVASTEAMLFNFRISSIHLSGSKKLLDKKLDANTQFYDWLLNLNYREPYNKLDQYYFKANNPRYIKDKCTYDYYNQVIKFLPWHEVLNINKCSLLTKNAKILMGIRFFADKLIKRNLR